MHKYTARVIDALAQTRVNLFDQFYAEADEDERATLDVMMARAQAIRSMGPNSAKELIMGMLTSPILDRIRRK
jgi:hypothetical protein